MVAKVLALAAVLAVGVNAACPNACSNQGECGTLDQCECYDGFYGGDCSLRVCPIGSAFVDTPAGDLNHDGVVGYGPSVSAYSGVQTSRYLAYESWPTLAGSPFSANVPQTDADGHVIAPTPPYTSPSTVGGWYAQPGEAHFLVECSGKGACDRYLGTCRCFDGYTGAACQRTTCPNDCSGNGLCRLTGEIAENAYDRTFVESVVGVNEYAGITSPYDYRLWDSDKNAACICDPGFTGIDCSLRVCPLGADPLTMVPSMCGGACADEQQAFSVDGGQGNAATLPGTYFLIFTDYSGGVYKTNEFALYTDNTVADFAALKLRNELAVKAALEELPNGVAGKVSVSTDSSYTGGAVQRSQLRLQVTFTTKSGNLPEMVLGWAGTSNAATLSSYVFQPGQPVQVLEIEPPNYTSGTELTTMTFKVYPVDQTLYGREAYWESSTDMAIASMEVINQRCVNGYPTGQVCPSAITDQIAAVADKIALQLNSIPAVKFAYGAPFVRDATVIVSQNPNFSGTYIVTIAFPDKQMGLNSLEYNFQHSDMSFTDPAPGVAVATATFSPTVATSQGDVINGNKEAVVCANRGLCDYTTGLCKCFLGFFGDNCGMQSAMSRGSK